MQWLHSRFICKKQSTALACFCCTQNNYFPVYNSLLSQYHKAELSLYFIYLLISHMYMTQDQNVTTTLTLSVGNNDYLHDLIFDSRKEMSLVFYHGHVNLAKILYCCCFSITDTMLTVFCEFMELTI